jgi:hypothetical protein
MGTNRTGPLLFQRGTKRMVRGSFAAYAQQRGPLRGLCIIVTRSRIWQRRPDAPWAPAPALYGPKALPPASHGPFPRTPYPQLGGRKVSRPCSLTLHAAVRLITGHVSYFAKTAPLCWQELSGVAADWWNVAKKLLSCLGKPSASSGRARSTLQPRRGFVHGQPSLRQSTQVSSPQS